MKSNKPKIEKKKFDPSTHWLYLLSVLSGIFLLIVAYGVYSFLYIKTEIGTISQEAEQNVQNASSSDFMERTKQNQKLSKDINDLNNTLSVFSQKEIDYNNALQNVKAAAPVATTTATTTVATSSNQ